jgi:hypothetical protein
MQYLCLVYHDESLFPKMSEEELAAMQRESQAHDAALERSGRLSFARPLKRPHMAKRVRVRALKRDVMDGPFAETKEQLIGFVLIEADSMEEAVDIAADIPLAKTGIIEVRGVSFHGDPELEQPNEGVA